MKMNTTASVYLIITLFLFTSCIKDLTVINEVYSNDFDTIKPNNNQQFGNMFLLGWNGGWFGPLDPTDQRIFNFNGNNVLGKFNNNLVLLDLANLPNHTTIRVSLDLYLHNNWRNDLWKMTFDGEEKLLTGFSNDSTIKQSYPNWLGSGSPLSPAGKNAIELNLPGICNMVSSKRGTSMYRLITTLSHSKDSFQLTFSDAGGNHNDTCQRSWSMDNLSINLIHN